MLLWQLASMHTEQADRRSNRSDVPEEALALYLRAVAERAGRSRSRSGLFHLAASPGCFTWLFHLAANRSRTSSSVSP